MRARVLLVCSVFEVVDGLIGIRSIVFVSIPEAAARSWSRSWTKSGPTCWTCCHASRLLTVASGLERGYGADVPKDIPNHAENLRALARSLREIFTAAHDIAAAVDTHNVALTTMRSDMNTQFAMVVVVTAIQIGHSMVRVEEPQAKQNDCARRSSSAGLIEIPHP